MSARIENDSVAAPTHTPKANVGEEVTEDGLLHLSAESAEHLFENAPDAMMIFNADGVILRVNAEAERIFGYMRHELKGESVDKLIPERFRRDHERLRANYLVKPGFRAMSALPNIVGLRRDGTEIPLEISLNPVETQAGVLLYSIIRDTTQRLAAHRCEREEKVERALSELSVKFVNLPSDRVDVEIESGLHVICEALSADRASLAILESNREDFLVTHAWARPEVPEFPKQFVRSLLPWLVDRTLNGGASLLRPSSLPGEALCEREYMDNLGIKVAMIVPFIIAGQVIGGMSCDAFREDQPWDPISLSRFQAVADVFANALTRKNADEKLQKAYIEIRELRDRIESENQYLRQEIETEHRHSAVVGEGAAIRNVLRRIEQVSPTDATVLIMGETGSGKELMARTVHEMSRRSKRPIVKTSCAALPATLIESELFGREKGAYTGALAREVGRFELADQSTIFLDEIGELPLELQPKLLRVLQEGEFERLGSPKTITVDVRVIAATSRDLNAMVREGKFREDLFYRLNVFPIMVPPLRERKEDIPALVWHILKKLEKRMGRRVEAVHKETMRDFQAYPWPGNVRELINVIERSLILNDGPVLRAVLPDLAPSQKEGNLRRLAEVESEYIRKVLESTHWRVRGSGGAADVLGLKPTTFEARLKKLGIKRPS